MEHKHPSQGRPVKTVFTEEEFKAFEMEKHVKVVNQLNGNVERPVCAGLDVHKRILVACVCVTDMKTLVPTYHVYKTTTFYKDVIELGIWMRSFGVVDVCMESTGKYWVSVFNRLEHEGFKPVLTHPKYVKSPKGKKTDEKDAMFIANTFRMGMVVPSFVPPQDIRDMRELCRYRIKLTYVKTAEKNRYTNSLELCDIRLDNVFKDVFGVTSQKLMEEILNNGIDNIDAEMIDPLRDRRCKASTEEILDAIKGGDFIGSEELLIKLHKKHIGDIDGLIAEIDKKLDEYGEKYSTEIAHLMSMVGVSRCSAIYILAEIGADMTVWNDCDEFSSWLGLVPASNSSANKHKSTKIGAGGYYIKPVLVECALAAIKSRKVPYFRYKYLAIKGRRGHKKAVIAIAHKMAICIYHMLLKGKDFMPSDLKAVDQEGYSKKINLNDTLSFLRASGISEDTLKVIANEYKNNKQNGGPMHAKSADGTNKQDSEGEALP